MTKSKVEDLTVYTNHMIPSRKVLEDAVAADLDAVIVVGRTQSGKLYMATSSFNEAENYVMLNRAVAEYDKLLKQELPLCTIGDYDDMEGPDDAA